MQNGTWIYEDHPICEPVDCGQPPLLPNGEVLYDSSTLHSLALYQCNRGYRPTEPFPAAACGADGSWNLSSVDLSCTLITCEPPLPITHGTVLHDDHLVSGAAAEYVCDRGFSLDGNPKRVCMEDGTWQGEDPSCLGIMGNEKWLFIASNDFSFRH